MSKATELLESMDEASIKSPIVRCFVKECKFWVDDTNLGSDSEDTEGGCSLKKIEITSNDSSLARSSEDTRCASFRRQ